MKILQEHENSGAKVESANYSLHFTGSGKEYFSIWLTNIALTILTLGIYGPWAKVRKLKYFYEHTYLDNNSFEYTAKPLTILKGRLIALAAILVIALVETTPLLIPLILIGIPLLPWLVNQALRFKARYTLYRNIPFSFNGTYGGTFYYLFFLKLLASIPFGLLLPWAKAEERQYLLSKLYYGTTPFRLSPAIWAFYRAYLIGFVLFLIPLAIFVARSFLIIFFDANGSAQPGGVIDLILGNVGSLALVLTGIIALLVPPAIIKVAVARATWNNALLGQLRLHYPLPLARYFGVFISNLLLTMVTLGLAAPYCAVRMHRFKLSHLSIEGSVSIDWFVSQRVEETNAIGDETAESLDLDIDMGF